MNWKDFTTPALLSAACYPVTLSFFELFLLWTRPRTAAATELYPDCRAQLERLVGPVQVTVGALRVH